MNNLTSDQRCDPRIVMKMIGKNLGYILSQKETSVVLIFGSSVSQLDQFPFEFIHTELGKSFKGLKKPALKTVLLNLENKGLIKTEHQQCLLTDSGQQMVLIYKSIRHSYLMQRLKDKGLLV